jgi:hypothetical protein
MKLKLGDSVGYQGIDYRVDDILTYALADRDLRLARLVAAGQVHFLEPPTSEASGRALVLTEIEGLDITAPPPATIYHRGESYLLKISGAAQVTTAKGGSGSATGTCTLWRYRAAGDQFLQIEQWPDHVRMFAGASVHLDMLEVRPATLKDSKDS